MAVAEGNENNQKLDIKQAYQQTEFGIAVDIGTTTLAFSLVNMHKGTVVSMGRTLSAGYRRQIRVKKQNFQNVSNKISKAV